MTLIATAAVVATLAALWSIRMAWSIPWERPAAMALVFMCSELLLISGPVSRWLSPKLYAVTGLWNIEDIIGHILLLFGLFSILYLVADRLDMSLNQFRMFVRQRMELPSLLVYPAMVAIFTCGGLGDRYVPDLIAEPPTLGMRAYWLAFTAVVLYISVHIFQVLRVLRRDPRSKRAATAYLCALGVTGVCMVAFILGIAPVQWVLVRCEIVGYAIAASYSWHTKVSHLGAL